ncbi:MAG: tetratricopeptide repeat protein [Candidatus Omnitrophota bacterium]|nr:tetratricopeptide repeat protein [Candidatus Omnitrophota bacterium]
MLIILGILLFFFILELGLRIGGAIFLARQEYRNQVSLRRKDSFRIMCLGESTTACGEENSYPSQLEKILNKRNIGIKFSVINKGVAGTNTVAVLNQLDDNLNKYKPHMVITMMGINDWGEHIPYNPIFAKGKSILSYFRTLKIYKFIRLLRLHIINKFQDKKYITFPNSNLAITETKEKNSNNINYPLNEASLKKAIEVNLKNYQAYKELGGLYRETERYVESEDYLNKALELNPKDDAIYQDLVSLYGGQGKFSQAEEVLKKWVELNPKNVRAYLVLGDCYLMERKFDQAEKALRQAIEIDPNCDGAYASLGIRYFMDGKFAQAEKALKRAVKINPRNEEAFGCLAILYREIGQHKSAKKCYEKVNDLRHGYYIPVMRSNYKKLKEILDKRKIQLVCVQYPVRSVEPLKKIFKKTDGIIFIDNEKVFKEALRKAKYTDYFTDIFGGEFGHCTQLGNHLLAENVANTILKEYFRK